MPDLRDLNAAIPKHIREGIKDRIRREIRSEYDTREKALKDGSESPSVAGLVFYKTGMGLYSALLAAGLDEMASHVKQQVDRLKIGLDPDFQRHQEERWSTEFTTDLMPRSSHEQPAEAQPS